jgi:hypothetical protein
MTMNTVKVDIEKMQLLNDRINQTIDALTQLRQTVHGYQPAYGLQHTQLNQPQPQAYFGPMQAGYPVQPYGLQHSVTPAYGQPAAFYTQQPYMGQQPMAQWGVQPWQTMQAGWQNMPQRQNLEFSGGISHSGQPGYDARTLRIAQAFPFAFSPVPLAT